MIYLIKVKTAGWGKTVKEARLNAILNYVRSKL